MPANTQKQVLAEVQGPAYASFRAAAISAVTRASRCAVKIQEQLLASDALTKSDNSPVTIADFAAQAIVIHDLLSAYPDIPFIAEEGSKDLTEEMSARVIHFLNEFIPGINHEQLVRLLDHPRDVESTFRWTLDPIDGTQGFLRREQYAVALALLENYVPVVGVLGCPALPAKLSDEQPGCLLVAVKGQGCVMKTLADDREIVCHVANTVASDDLVCTESPNAGHSSPHLESIAQGLGIRKSSIKIDSQCKYALVARGEAGLYLRYSGIKYKEKIWDHAAGLLCVEEAGGRVTDITGAPLDFSKGESLFANTGIVASNGKTHAQVLEVIARVDPIGKDSA